LTAIRSVYTLGVDCPPSIGASGDPLINTYPYTGPGPKESLTTTTADSGALSRDDADTLVHQVLGAADTLNADTFAAFFADDAQSPCGRTELRRVHGATSGCWKVASIADVGDDIRSVSMREESAVSVSVEGATSTPSTTGRSHRPGQQYFAAP